MMRRVRSSNSGHTALNFRANAALELMDRNHVRFPLSCYLYLLTTPKGALRFSHSSPWQGQSMRMLYLKQWLTRHSGAAIFKKVLEFRHPLHFGFPIACRSLQHALPITL